MKFVSRLLRTNRKLILGISVLMLVALGGVATKVGAADCDNNAIIKCGFGSPSSFISTVRANDSGNGHQDLQPIYAAYGLEPTDYDRFVTSARQGTAFKDGRIVVDNQVVATNAKSIGRQASMQGAGYFSQDIPGAGTFYGNTNDRAFATDSLPVTVMFNSQGQAEFAVINSCGNPIKGTDVTPTYSCNALHSTPVSGQPGTYSFTTDASAGDNAAIAKVVYDFGDGSTATVTNPNTPVQHTYDKDGTYNAKVTVYVTLPGNQTITVTSANCATVITVVLPAYTCVQLTYAILDSSKHSYAFTAKSSVSGGVAFTSADFDFGDGTNAQNQQPQGDQVTVNHTFPDNKGYTVKATLNFTMNGVVKSVNCQASTSTTPECKPGIPEGSPQCATTPPVLPNTGAGQVIGIGTAVAVAGFLLFRQFIYKKQLPHASEGTMTMEGLFKGPVVSDHTGAVVSHHIRPKHRQHPNAVHPLHHPTYHKPHRFRPQKHDDQ